MPEDLPTPDKSLREIEKTWYNDVRMWLYEKNKYDIKSNYDDYNFYSI